jgi:hypothetical protein
MNPAANPRSRLLDVPVLFLVFNRPDSTKAVFDAIRNARPARLYVAADGPRSNRTEDKALIEEVREIATRVDWPCEVKTLFREENLGCREAVGQAISWFFDHEEQGIILEDDCLPSASFFWFCSNLLNLYKDDTRIMMISGYNSEQTWGGPDSDYFFSNLGGVWGWASWRRAWSHYDADMRGLESAVGSGILREVLGNRVGRLRAKHLVAAKSDIRRGRIDSWAFPWGLSRNLQGGLACVPRVSLVQNIGTGRNATHTKFEIFGLIEARDLDFPLRLNSKVEADEAYDWEFVRKGTLWKLLMGITNRGKTGAKNFSV